MLFSSVGFATATLATFATLGTNTGLSVATVASVAVANFFLRMIAYN